MSNLAPKDTVCICCGTAMKSNHSITICENCLKIKNPPIENEYRDMTFPSGKYEGELISDVCMDDEDYCTWVAEDSSFRDDVKNAVMYHLGWED